MFYNIGENKHEERFVNVDDIQNNINMIFQSDCDVINQHLDEQYGFDIINNKYKFYLPNLMRHYGKVDKDQYAHSDFNYMAIEFKDKKPKKKTKT